MLTKRDLSAASLLLTACLATSAAVSAENRAASDYERLWSRAELYVGDEATFFQSVKFTGRLQFDLARVSEETREDEFNLRRFRRHLDLVHRCAVKGRSGGEWEYPAETRKKKGRDEPGLSCTAFTVVRQSTSNSISSTGTMTVPEARNIEFWPAREA